MTSPRFMEFPKKWGIYLPFTGKPQKLKDHDLDLLRKLQERYRDQFEGEPVPIKGHIGTLFGKKGWIGLRSTLLRLWQNDIVYKFAKSFHTQSDRPNYGSYWIWEDIDGLSDRETGDSEWDSTTAPAYIMS